MNLPIESQELSKFRTLVYLSIKCYTLVTKGLNIAVKYQVMISV